MAIGFAVNGPQTWGEARRKYVAIMKGLGFRPHKGGLRRDFGPDISGWIGIAQAPRGGVRGTFYCGVIHHPTTVLMGSCGDEAALAGMPILRASLLELMPERESDKRVWSYVPFEAELLEADMKAWAWPFFLRHNSHAEILESARGRPGERGFGFMSVDRRDFVIPSLLVTGGRRRDAREWLTRSLDANAGVSTALAEGIVQFSRRLLEHLDSVADGHADVGQEGA